MRVEVDEKLVQSQTEHMVGSYNGNTVVLQAAYDGSIPSPTTKIYALLVQLVETLPLEGKGYRFESYVGHQVRSYRPMVGREFHKLNTKVRFFL